MARTTVSSRPLAKVSDSISVVKPGLYSLQQEQCVQAGLALSHVFGTVIQLCPTGLHMHKEGDLVSSPACQPSTPVEHLLNLSPLSASGLCHHFLRHRRRGVHSASLLPVPAVRGRASLQAPGERCPKQGAAWQGCPALPRAVCMMPAASGGRARRHAAPVTNALAPCCQASAELVRPRRDFCVQAPRQT